MADSKDTTKEALRVLIAAMDSDDDILKQVVAERHNVQFEDEKSKPQPLPGFTVAPKMFEDLCSHMEDGGGVLDDMAPVDGGDPLTVRLWQSIADRDQATFWDLMPQLLKSILVQRKLIVKVPGNPGATMRNGLRGPAIIRSLSNVPGTTVTVTRDKPVEDVLRRDRDVDS